METTYIDPRKLTPHPKNAAIYNNDKDQLDTLTASIKAHGVLDDLVVSKNNVIISGHRRAAAAIEAGLREVPVKVVDIEIDESTPEQSLLAAELLVEHNIQRRKTAEEIVAEADYLKEIIEAKKASGVDVVKESGFTRTRDYLANRLGISSRGLGRAERVMKEIESEEDEERKEALTEAMNKSTYSAERMIAGEEEVEDDEETTEEIPIDYNTTPDLEEEDGEYFYVHELRVLVASMEAAYLNLSKQRNGSTPKAVGHMIGNIKDMQLRLITWLPEYMANCPKCSAGKLETVDEDGDIQEHSCDSCVAGKIGLFKESEN